MRLLWGDLLDGDGMCDTPKRVVKLWMEITRGLYEDPAIPLQKTFECDHDELVLIRDIPVQSLCEHHLLPVEGVAHVAYIPNGRVVGLSKIPRAMDILARRPQLQERLTNQLGKVIGECLNPKGVAVVIEARHGCMTTRGVLKPGSITTTSFVSGVFRSDASARAEVMNLLK